MPRPANGPAAGVAAFVFRYNNGGNSELLVIKRKGSHGAGTWSVPGGWVEDGETIEEAVIRELQEETGLQAYQSWNDVQVPWIHHMFDDGTNSICINYRCLVRSLNDLEIGEPDKVEEVAWVSLHKLHELELFPMLQEWVERHSLA